MNFIYFNNTIFLKENFEEAIIKKDTITVYFQKGNSLVHKYESEEKAKIGMEHLCSNLND